MALDKAPNNWKKEDYREAVKFFGKMLALIPLEKGMKVYFNEEDLKNYLLPPNMQASLFEAAAHTFYEEGNKSFQRYLEPVLLNGTVRGIEATFDSVFKDNALWDDDVKKAQVGQIHANYTGQCLIYFKVVELVKKGLFKSVKDCKEKIVMTEMLADILAGVQEAVGSAHKVYFGLVYNPTDHPYEFNADYLFTLSTENVPKNYFTSANFILRVFDEHKDFHYCISLDTPLADGPATRPFMHWLTSVE